jgi:hypothetical protein
MIGSGQQGTGLLGMNHTVDPLTAAAAASQRSSDLAPKFKANTVFSTVTHGIGQGDGLRASTNDDMYFTWIEDQVKTNRGDVPLYNLVVIFACQGLYVNKMNWIAYKFGIRDGNTYTPQSIDAAVAGTGAVISAMSPNDVNIPAWFEQFYGYLKQGYTIEDAEANIHKSGLNLYTTGGSTFRPIFVGDKKTKLYGVYGLERSTAWYIVFSP